MSGSSLVNLVMVSAKMVFILLIYLNLIQYQLISTAQLFILEF